MSNVISHRGKKASLAAAIAAASGCLVIGLGTLMASPKYGQLEAPRNAVSAVSPGAGRVRQPAVSASKLLRAPSTRPLTTPAVVTLTLPAELRVGGAVDRVRVQVADAGGRPVADGTEIQLSTTLGYLGSQRLLTVGGEATTTLRSGIVAGRAVVVARSGPAVAQGSVVFRPDVPAIIAVIAPEMASVMAPVVVSATLSDRFANLIPDGWTVAFTSSSGTVEPGLVELRQGVAAGRWTNRRAGTAVITATCGSLSGSAVIWFRAGAPAAIEVQLEPRAIPVDEGHATVSARVLDVFGNLTVLERALEFRAQEGVVVPSVVQRVQGVAKATFRAGPRAGTALVEAVSGELLGRGTVEVKPADLKLLRAELTGPRGPTTRSQTYPGEAVTYTLVVGNQGLARARDIRLATELPRLLAARPLALPEGARLLQPVPRDLLSAPAPENEAFAWSLPDLGAQQAATLTLLGRVPWDHAWSGFDTFPVRAVITTTTAEASVADLRRSDSLQVYSADLAVSMSLDTRASTLRAGGQLVYDIAFSNRQPQTQVSAVRITSTLGAGLTYDHWQAQQGTVLRPATNFGPASRELVWEFAGPFALSQGFRLWLRIGEGLMPDTVLEHYLAIGSPVYDVDASNNEQSSRVQLRGVNLTADLHAPEVAAAGDEISHEVLVRNTVSTDSALNVTVEAKLPAVLRIQRTHPLGILLGDGRVRWLLEDLPAGGERRFEVVSQLADDVPLGTFVRSQVMVESSPPDAYSGDNQAEAWTRVVAGPPAQMELSSSTSKLRACSEDQAIVTAVVRDRTGNPVADGSVVRWQTIGGNPAEGQSETVDGMAQTVVTAGPQAGPLTVVATSGAARAERTMELVPGPPTVVAVLLQPNVARPRELLSAHVFVRSWCDNLVADGWPVDMFVQGGSFFDGSARISLTTSGGGVTAGVRAGSQPGSLVVRARAGAIEGQASARILGPTSTRLYVPLVLRR